LSGSNVGRPHRKHLGRDDSSGMTLGSIELTVLKDSHREMA